MYNINMNKVKRTYIRYIIFLIDWSQSVLYLCAGWVVGSHWRVYHGSPVLKAETHQKASIGHPGTGTWLNFLILKWLAFATIVFFLKKYYFLLNFRTGELANFFSGSGSWLFFKVAPTPVFFPKRLRLLVFFSRSAPAPRGQKNRPGLLTIG